jgi:hypothetical protein
MYDDQNALLSRTPLLLLDLSPTCSTTLCMPAAADVSPEVHEETDGSLFIGG